MHFDASDATLQPYRGNAALSKGPIYFFSFFFLRLLFHFIYALSHQPFDLVQIAVLKWALFCKVFSLSQLLAGTSR